MIGNNAKTLGGYYQVQRIGSILGLIAIRCKVVISLFPLSAFVYEHNEFLDSLLVHTPLSCTFLFDYYTMQALRTILEQTTLQCIVGTHNTLQQGEDTRNKFQKLKCS